MGKPKQRTATTTGGREVDRCNGFNTSKMRHADERFSQPLWRSGINIYRIAAQTNGQPQATRCPARIPTGAEHVSGLLSPAGYPIG